MNLDPIAPALDLALPPCLSNSAPEQSTTASKRSSIAGTASRGCWGSIMEESLPATTE